MTGGEEFYYVGNNGIGVLLIHGYTGTPAELKELGILLNKEGYTVHGVLLPGHNTEPDDLESVTWEEWFERVKVAYYELGRNTSRQIVMGMSMGGLLALVAGHTFQAEKVVLMSTPIFLFDWRVKFIGILKYFIKSIKKRPRKVKCAEEYNVSYDVLPVLGVVQVNRLMEHCKKNIIPQFDRPCLIIQSLTDGTVKPSSGEYIYENIASKIKKLFFLKKSKHVVTLYDARDKVYAEIIEFLNK